MYDKSLNAIFQNCHMQSMSAKVQMVNCAPFSWQCTVHHSIQFAPVNEILGPLWLDQEDTDLITLPTGSDLNGSLYQMI